MLIMWSMRSRNSWVNLSAIVTNVQAAIQTNRVCRTYTGT